MNIDYWRTIEMGNPPTVEEMQKATERFLNGTNQPRRNNAEHHSAICSELNNLYAKKNADYGDSFHLSYLEWGATMSAIRLGDKYNRFCNLLKTQQKVDGESIRDTLLDLANYAIMTIMEIDHDKKI